MDSIRCTAESFDDFRQVFACIDNTTLEGSDTDERVKQLCKRSLELQDVGKGVGHVAAVCVYPVFVRKACKYLNNSGIMVASVAGAFPSGQSPIAVKLQEVKYAIDEGADEIDMVISRGALLEGDYGKVYDEIAAIREVVGSRTLKVILETGELQTKANIAKASELAIHAGADFIKTSTGKIAVSATLEAAEVMLTEIKKHYDSTGKWVGFKAAGGISMPDDALEYCRLTKRILGKECVSSQFFRIGASRLTERLFAYLTE